MENQKKFTPQKPFQRGTFERKFSGSGGRTFQPREGGTGRSFDKPGQRDDRFRPRDGRFSKPNRFGAQKGFKPRVGGKKNWDQPRAPKIVSDLQITDGKFRGKYIKNSLSPRMKPSPGHIRGIMLKMLSRRIRAGRILDLCSGAGMIGLEAISRGAMLSTFVERSAKMCSFIRKNVAAFGIKEGHFELFEIETVPFMKRMEKRKRLWDIVYFSPAYDGDYEETLDFLKRGVCIRHRGTLVIEHHAEMFFPEELGCLKRWRVVTEGDSALSFYEKR